MLHSIGSILLLVLKKTQVKNFAFIGLSVSQINALEALDDISTESEYNEILKQ